MVTAGFGSVERLQCLPRKFQFPWIVAAGQCQETDCFLKVLLGDCHITATLPNLTQGQMGFARSGIIGSLALLPNIKSLPQQGFGFLLAS